MYEHFVMVSFVFIVIRQDVQQIAVLKVVPNGRNGSSKKTPSKFTSLYSKGTKTILHQRSFYKYLQAVVNKVNTFRFFLVRHFFLAYLFIYKD